VRDCSDTWQPLTRQSKSQHWSTSQLWPKRVNVGQTGYFTLFLVGGSSVGTLNGLEKEGII